MKKILIGIVTVTRAILLYFTVVIDRLSMALFIGVPLPDTNYSKDIPKVDENTTNEEIENIVEMEDRLNIKYIKDYLPKARKRTLIVISILTAIYLGTVLSWFYIGITVGIIINILIVVFVVQFTRGYFSDKNKKQDEHTNNRV